MTPFRSAAVTVCILALPGAATTLSALSAPGKTGQTRGTNGQERKRPPDPRLAAVLREWKVEQRTSVEWHRKFTWTDRRRDPLEGKRVNKVYQGELFVKAPDHLRVDLRDPQGRAFLTMLCVGDEARFYQFGEKREVIVALTSDFRMPERVFGAVEKKRTWVGSMLEALTWPVFGPPLTRLEGRFVLRVEKEDDDWTYIRLEPVHQSWWLPDDEWQVVLSRKKRWLRRVWSRGGFPGEGLTVEFDEPQEGPLPPRTWEPLFTKPPKGWERLDAREGSE
jgi:hypothetical protein